MVKGQSAGDSPIGVNVIEGKSYYWCTCGKVLNNPFVMVLIKVRNLNLLIFIADQSKKVFSAHVNKQMIKPLCDGSHNIK